MKLMQDEVAKASRAAALEFARDCQREEDEKIIRAMTAILQAQADAMKAAGWIHVWDDEEVDE